MSEKDTIPLLLVRDYLNLYVMRLMIGVLK